MCQTQDRSPDRSRPSGRLPLSGQAAFLHFMKTIHSPKDRARGYEPRNQGSNPCGLTMVAVADLAMHRIVDPENAGSNPVGYPSGGNPPMRKGEGKYGFYDELPHH